MIEWETSRLVAQLKANIEQLDMLIVGASDIKKHIIGRGWTGVEFKKKIISVTEKLILEHIIPEEHRPKDLSRYAENILKLFENSNDLRGRFKKRNFDVLLGLYESKLKEYSDNFPMSVSLYQVVLGIFIEEDKLTDAAKLNFLITNEMNAFSKTKLINNIVKI